MRYFTLKKNLMKKLTIVLSLLVMALAINAQSVIYKADKWGNTKMYKSWTRALDNPILEKVVIKQNNKAFEITFNGKRSLSYTIQGVEKLSSYSTKFNVKAKDQAYIITVSFIEGSYYIYCENEWVVGEIKDMSSTNE